MFCPTRLLNCVVVNCQVFLKENHFGIYRRPWSLWRFNVLGQFLFNIYNTLGLSTKLTSWQYFLYATFWNDFTIKNAWLDSGLEFSMFLRHNPWAHVNLWIFSGIFQWTSSKICETSTDSGRFYKIPSTLL